MALRHRTSSQKFCSGWVAFALLRFGHNRTCTAIGIGNANGLLHADQISKVMQVRWVATMRTVLVRPSPLAGASWLAQV
jgi:hypothetical protein